MATPDDVLRMAMGEAREALGARLREFKATPMGQAVSVFGGAFLRAKGEGREVTLSDLRDAIDRAEAAKGK